MSELFIDEIVRSKRRTLSIEVREGKLIVRAPRRMPVHDIAEFVVTRRDWILKNKAKYVDLVPLEFTPGELFYFMGARYPLQLTKRRRPSLALENNSFWLAENKLSSAQALFVKWYRNQAKAILAARVESCAKLAQLEYNGVKINGAKRRWGSCSETGNINFSWRLMMAPSGVIDYVVAHEVAHLAEMNHSSRFWVIVERLMPDYKDKERWLKEHGHRLIF